MPLPAHLPTRNYMQMAWVVPDLDAAIASWVTNSGVGPFFVFDSVEFGDPVYRGKPSVTPKNVAAMAYAGDIQIELIQPLEDKPSLWTDRTPFGRPAFHHVAVNSENYAADLAFFNGQGAETAFSGVMLGYPVCWIDTFDTLGFMMELMTPNPMADAVFGQIKAASVGWDGKDPVRKLG
jgi:hypothetical protein